MLDLPNGLSYLLSFGKVNKVALKHVLTTKMDEGQDRKIETYYMLINNCVLVSDMRRTDKRYAGRRYSPVPAVLALPWCIACSTTDY